MNKIKISGLILSALLLFSCGDNSYKDYILDHADQITKDESDDGAKYYRIDITESSYYTDITIRQLDDSSYTAVFWGDRESFLWDFRLDHDFTIDVPYNRYKNKNVERDVKILEALNKL